jgi:hypothetical protein
MPSEWGHSQIKLPLEVEPRGTYFMNASLHGHYPPEKKASSSSSST